MRDAVRNSRLLAPSVRPRFLLDRARHVAGPRPYRLRGGRLVALLEHRTNDISALVEIVGEDEYAPPAEAAARLDAGAPLDILDLGAHVGLAALWCLGRWPGSRVTSVEPDRRSVASLRRTMTANPGLRWELREAAAATAPGRVRFHGGLHMGSHVSADGTGEVEALDVLPLIAAADLVKCDIEGSEWAILADPRLAESGPTVLVVEVHPQDGADFEPSAHAAELLRAAGFEVAPARSKPDGLGLLWAWR